MASGIPLLSGPPPAQPETPACRRCNREFNFIFLRAKQCYHCGYSYCPMCTDYSALLPRDNGYTQKQVCAFCIEYLTITAAGKGALRSISLSKLKKYVNAYNIRMDRAVEKDDVIDAIIAVRAPNGCLPAKNEDHYRQHSVPDHSADVRRRGLFSRSNASAAPSRAPDNSHRSTFNRYSDFERPDLQPDSPHYAPPPGPPPRSPPTQSYPPHDPNHATYNPDPRRRTQSHSNSRSSSRAQTPHSPPQPRRHPSPDQRPSPSPPSGRAAPPPPPPPPPPPRPATPPNLDTLLEMSSTAISALSVSALKAILFNNHVHAGVGVLEKRELVGKVQALVEDERRERARHELEERREMEMEEARRNQEEQEERAMRESTAEQQQRSEQTEDTTIPDLSSSTSVNDQSDHPAAPSLPPKAQALADHLERTGLCVICQDEEANIAIVDCGHLCLCRPCSHIIMANTRECPLCRTRIVTEARLLRIFKS